MHTEISRLAAISAEPDPNLAELVREWRIVHGQLDVDCLKFNRDKPGAVVDDIVAAADRKLEAIEDQILVTLATSMDEVRGVLNIVLAGMEAEAGYITERRAKLLQHVSECIRLDLLPKDASRAA